MSDRYFLSAPDLTIDRAEIACITRVSTTATGEPMRLHHINIHRSNGFTLSFEVAPEKSRDAFESVSAWFVRGLPVDLSFTSRQLGLVDSEVSE